MKHSLVTQSCNLLREQSESNDRLMIFLLPAGCISLVQDTLTYRAACPGKIVTGRRQMKSQLCLHWQRSFEPKPALFITKPVQRTRESLIPVTYHIPLSCRLLFARIHNDFNIGGCACAETCCSTNALRPVRQIDGNHQQLGSTLRLFRPEGHRPRCLRMV